MEDNQKLSGKQLEETVSSLIEQDALQKDNLELSSKPPVPVLVHGKERLWVAAGALSLCLILPVLPWTPDNIKTGMITIAGSIATSLFKGFEKH